MNVLIGQHEGSPDILGSFGVVLLTNFVSASGAFRNINSTKGGEVVQNNNYRSNISFKASKGEIKKNANFKNDVYGKSDHLQTSNITVRYWKRTA